MRIMPRGRTFSLSFPPFTRAVKWLVLTNAAVFLLITLLKAFAPGFGSVVFSVLSLVPEWVMRGAIWQLISYSFLHVSLFHIFFNMLWLWMFGARLESDWGYRKFLEFY